MKGKSRTELTLTRNMGRVLDSGFVKLYSSTRQRSPLLMPTFRTRSKLEYNNNSDKIKEVVTAEREAGTRLHFNEKYINGKDKDDRSIPYTLTPPIHYTYTHIHSHSLSLVSKYEIHVSTFCQSHLRFLFKISQKKKKSFCF